MTTERFRLLVMTLHYPPDGGPSAPLYGMLCKVLAKRGVDVTVVSAVPHYPSGRVQSPYRGRCLWRTVEDGVRIVRVWVPSVDRARLFLRALQFLCFQVGAVFGGLSRRYDAALFSNPGLDVVLPFTLQVALRRTPAVFSVADVYPDVGIALGIFRAPWVISAVSTLERFCLTRSRFVRILSESFAPAMRRLGVPDPKLALIYDWVDTDLIRPLPRDNEFARKTGLSGFFVVLYAGNIGLSQGLENVLFAAERLASQRDILFVLVGDGTGRAPLRSEARRRSLGNVRFLPFQPRQELPLVLASGDVSLVLLKKGIGRQSLPSKSYSILASGRPLLASVDEQSATADLVLRSQGGLCVPPEDPEGLAGSIMKLKSSPELCEQLGRNGRLYAERYLSPESAARQFETLLRKAASKTGPRENEVGG